MKVKSNKHHLLNQSCFYKLKSEKKLAKFLLCSNNDIKMLLENNNNYNTFYKKKGDKLRLIENPCLKLKKIQRRIHDLLSRIEAPNYLHSSIKMRSCKTNASQHLNEDETFKVDIKKFFPSIIEDHIIRFFVKKMCCSLKIAGLLAKICIYDGHLPTGGPHSPILAFYSHKDMFDRINRLAEENNLVMTLYADDICLSGGTVTKKIRNLINTIIKQAGLKNNKPKERYYKKGDVKKITGVIIKNGEMKIPNKLHKEIYEGFKAIDNLKDKVTQKKILKSIAGKAASANQIVPTKWVDRIKKKKQKIELRAE